MGNAGRQHDRVLPDREGERVAKVPLVLQFLKGGESTNVVECNVGVPFRSSSGAARQQSRDGLRVFALACITACLRLVFSFSSRRAVFAALAFSWFQLFCGFVGGRVVCSHDFTVAPFGCGPR